MSCSSTYTKYGISLFLFINIQKFQKIQIKVSMLNFFSSKSLNSYFFARVRHRSFIWNVLPFYHYRSAHVCSHAEMCLVTQPWKYENFVPNLIVLRTVWKWNEAFVPTTLHSSCSFSRLSLPLYLPSSCLQSAEECSRRVRVSELRFPYTCGTFQVLRWVQAW